MRLECLEQPERFGDATREASRIHPPFAENEHLGSAIDIRPLDPTFGPNLQEFHNTLRLEISTTLPVATLYYTLNGSDPSPENYDGAGFEDDANDVMIMMNADLRDDIPAL